MALIDAFWTPFFVEGLLMSSNCARIRANVSVNNWSSDVFESQNSEYLNNEHKFSTSLLGVPLGV